MKDIEEILDEIDNETYEAENLELAEEAVERTVDLDTSDQIAEWARKAAEIFEKQSE